MQIIKNSRNTHRSYHGKAEREGKIGKGNLLHSKEALYARQEDGDEE
jgi:hypothetical protein